MWLEYFGLYDPVIFYVFIAVSAVIVGLGVATALIGCCYKRKFMPGATIDHSIILGCFLLCSTVLLRGISTDYGDFEIYEDICQVYVAPHMLALAYLFGGFLVKAMAIYHYHKYDDGSEVRNVEWRPLGWLFLVVAVDAVVIIVWCVLFPMKLYRGWKQMDGGMNSHMNPINMTAQPSMPNIYTGQEVYTCYGEYGWEWKISMSAYHGFLLLLAAIMVWPAMHYSKRRVCATEATYLAVMVSNAVLAVIAGALLYFFLEVEPLVHYAVNGGILLYIALATIVILLISAVTALRRKPKRDDEMTLKSVDSSTRGSVAYHDNEGYTKPVNNLAPHSENFNY